MMKWLDNFSDYELGQATHDPNEINLTKFNIKYRKLVSWAFSGYPYDAEAPDEREDALTRWIFKAMKFTWDYYRQARRGKSLSHLGGYLAD